MEPLIALWETETTAFEVGLSLYSLDFVYPNREPVGGADLLEMCPIKSKFKKRVEY